MTIEELIEKVPDSQIIELKEELIVLLNREIFEKTYYFRQLQKFEGKIFDTIKWLMNEEEKHIYFLSLLLMRVGVSVPTQVENLPKLPDDNQQVIISDIQFEQVTTQEYNDALDKLEPLIEKTDGALKEILTHIRDEELYHIKLLSQYVEENSDL
jgi:hypothetical protein